MNYEPVIGLEIHAQLLTQSKLFCACSTAFGATPNTNTCPVCLGLPGVLPVLNKKAVEFAIKAALALNCTIQPRSIWARKNYFYPDLPKGYQISQYEEPLSTAGFLEIRLNGKSKKIRITRIHMEEDAGKLLHEGRDLSSSYVDLNRAGVPLIEIVSEPDLGSAAEAGEYLRQVRSILRYCKVCDGNMEEGSLRCDANVSVRPVGSEKLGTKVELKNMNSFRFVEKAIEYEISRQITAVENGEKIVQETRLWDTDRSQTAPMRSKEFAHDYRYFPDPDLVPLLVEEAWVNAIRRNLPELPQEKIDRFVRDFILPEYDAQILTGDADLADFFEAAVAAYPQAKKISNWIMTELLRELKTGGKEIGDSKVKPQQLARLVQMIDEGKISGKIAKTVFEKMVATGTEPETIVADEGLIQVSDAGAIESVIEKVKVANPEQLAQYKSGKEKLFGFFVGQVMKEMKGQGNPALVNELLKKKL